MCNCRGSEWSKASDKEFPTWHSVSVTWGDIAGIKSCNSVSTGGGEGCLMMSAETGDSAASKEIMEKGSSVQWVSISSFGLEIDCTLDFSGSTLALSVFIVIELSKGCCRLVFNKEDQITLIGTQKKNSKN